MKATIQGRAYVLGDDVDTDQIIPAKYLAISLSDPAQRSRYGGLALSGVPDAQAGLPDGARAFADSASNRSPYSIVVAGRNFGCGSSREHALVALAEAGVGAIVARSYSRIFYRNAVDGGYFPPFQCDHDLHRLFCTGDELIVECEAGQLRHKKSGRRFELGELGAALEIVRAGGLFAYARMSGRLSS